MKYTFDKFDKTASSSFYVLWPCTNAITYTTASDAINAAREESIARGANVYVLHSEYVAEHDIRVVKMV